MSGGDIGRTFGDEFSGFKRGFIEPTRGIQLERDLEPFRIREIGVRNFPSDPENFI